MLSDSNLHPILFQMEPYPTIISETDVPILIDQATGLIEYGNNNNILRYFSHIPRWVAFDVSGALMELWLRLDPRVEMSDILDRLNLIPGKKVPKPNAYNMRRLRFRETINVPGFTTGRQHPTTAEVDLIFLQTREQILLNTAMIVDLPNNRLLKPDLIADGYIDSGLPLDYFLRGFSAPIQDHIPSNRQNLVLELRKRMQRIAMHHGLGTHPQDFHKLPRDLDPAWWHKGEAGTRQITEIDGKTHYEWMSELNERYPGITRSGVQRKAPTKTTVAGQQTRAQAALPPPPPPPAALLPPPTTPPPTVALVDVRFLSGAAAFEAPVPPRHAANNEGGTSYYLEPVLGSVAAAAGAGVRAGVGRLTEEQKEEIRRAFLD